MEIKHVFSGMEAAVQVLEVALRTPRGLHRDVGIVQEVLLLVMAVHWTPVSGS